MNKEHVYQKPFDLLLEYFRCLMKPVQNLLASVFSLVWYNVLRASLVTQMVKNPPAMRESWVRSLGWEDPLEEGMATHCSILAWRIPMDRGAWRATVYKLTNS